MLPQWLLERGGALIPADLFIHLMSGQSSLISKQIFLSLTECYFYL